MDLKLSRHRNYVTIDAGSRLDSLLTTVAAQLLLTNRLGAACTSCSR